MTMTDLYKELRGYAGKAGFAESLKKFAVSKIIKQIQANYHVTYKDALCMLVLDDFLSDSVNKGV